MKILSDYLSDLFVDYQKAVDLFVENLKRLNIEFDTIAFRGMSGCLVGPTVAYLMGKQMLMIRKKGTSHSSFMVEGTLNPGKILIIDDFKCTGQTIQIILNEIYYYVKHHITKKSPTTDAGISPVEIVGVALYRDHWATQQCVFDQFEKSKTKIKLSILSLGMRSHDPNRKIKYYPTEIISDCI